ncbi:hypothetical protein MUK42_27777 [Musa troglodytarum]|uniref:Uncharacterized protein n=1 Tax=Musa troglodytarum TaxID=320322 RepID=A0A9E7F698_9LILI|nr:hypothetical protein MUK42_27777 [Musa troglodytarum]
MEPVASPTFPDLISVRVLLLSFLTHRLCVAACSMISYELVRSRYVKLTKDQDAPLEEIRPGELNQPLGVRRCPECGQPLPESYEPPADEC